MEPLRLMLFDVTCRGRPVGLADAWSWGGGLYGALGRLHAWKGVSAWDDGLHWLATYAPDRPIGEVQVWGHGRWGLARMGATQLDRGSLRGSGLDPVRARLAPDALWWFRTCETVGATRGRDFAMAFADHLGCDVAGHTYIIGPWQSGLHRLSPGRQPSWSPDEGLAEGTPDAPIRARWSSPWAPRTISCLRGDVPRGW